MMTSKTPDSPQLALLARIRHELRTLLNAIIGYSEMLLEDAEGERNEEWVSTLEDVLEAGKLVSDIVNQKLDPTSEESSLTQFDPKILGEQLRQELQAPLALIIYESDTLLQSAREYHQDDICKDLQKINLAAQSFVSKLSTPEELPGMQTLRTEAGNEAFIAGPISAAPELHGNILVVDDNETNRDVLSRHLARQGHSVRLAEGGQQALGLLKDEARTLDLVLLDVVMPGMNGIQLLQHLKNEPTTRDIPVIMISALDEMDIVVQCIQIGAEDYLPKPFNSVLLKTRTMACLEKKRLRDQEIEYLVNVALITDAAAAVEGKTFDPKDLAEVARRTDALGQLARVFQRMAREVHAREECLHQQVLRLRIELDAARQSQQVSEITESEYFQKLKAETQSLRRIIRDGE